MRIIMGVAMYLSLSLLFDLTWVKKSRSNNNKSTDGRDDIPDATRRGRGTTSVIVHARTLRPLS